MSDLILIAHNLRSAHNVGSLLRTAEGLGIKHVYLTGYTPYPKSDDDKRLPHEALKVHKQIVKTALGAERLVDWHHQADVFELISSLKTDGYVIAALEQSKRSASLIEFEPPQKLALIVGREVEGVETEILDLTDHVLEIPMQGKKESFNVVQAAAMALFLLSLKQQSGKIS